MNKQEWLNKNLTDTRQGYSKGQSYFSSSTWWKLALVGALHLPTSMLLRYFIGTAVIKSNESAFSGFSGLALGLAFVYILSILTFILTPIVTGFILKYLGQKRPFLISVVGTLFIYLITGTLSAANLSLPIWIIIPILLASGSLAYMLAWKLLDANKNPVWRIAFLCLALLVLGFASSVLASYRYEKPRAEERKNRNFSLYAPSASFFDKYSIQNSDSITVVFAKTILDTPKGQIQIRQTQIDHNLKNMLVPPNSCDHRAIYDYINIWGVKEYPTATTKKCVTVYEEGERLVMMADKSDKNVSSSAPFVASVGDTVIIFNAYASTYGDFRGSVDEAQKYVVDFIKNSRVIENQEIGL